jgi:predicted MFS family arabinose efflux permease
MLAREGLLREGNALLNLGGTIGGAIGPALAGIIVATWSPGAALLIDSGTFLIAAALVGTAAGLRIESDTDSSPRGRIQAGLQVVRSRPIVGRLLIAVAVAMAFSSVAVPIEVVFAERTLHAGDTGYGLLLAAWGVGMIVGGIAFATARRTSLSTVLGIGALLVAGGYGGMAVAPNIALACTFAAVGGAGNGSAWIAAVTGVQQGVPLTSQSLVMSVLEGINQVMPAIGFMVGGVVTDLSSPRTAYAISAIGVVLVVAASVRPLRGLGQLLGTGEFGGGIILRRPQEPGDEGGILECNALLVT